ncbi:MAG: hypothetical protein KF819_04650 [Labilithrix sp.]|nr:hypothetical protein [Labilithrix sp.]
MTDLDPIDPLDPELAKLFRDEPTPEPSAGMQARVAAKLATSGVLTPVVTPVGVLPKLLMPITTFVVGAGVGVAVLATLQAPTAERVVYIDRPVATLPPSVRAVPTVPPVSASISAVTSSAAAPPRLPAVASSAPAHDDLLEERVLLDASRAKLSGGDAAAAMVLLAEHERRFARGRLVEERDALAVQALVNAGRYDEARTRAAALERRYPNSVYLPAVNITLESIP